MATSSKEQPKYSFNHEKETNKAFTSAKMQASLSKWGMQNMFMKRFHYDHSLRPRYTSIESFLTQFFNSPSVNLFTLGTVEGIQLETIASTATSLDVFDSLGENREIIRQGGEIKKCFGIVLFGAYS